MWRKSKLLAPVSKLSCWHDKVHTDEIINYLFTRGHNQEVDCASQTLLIQTWSSNLVAHLNHLEKAGSHAQKFWLSCCAWDPGMGIFKTSVQEYRAENHCSNRTPEKIGGSMGRRDWAGVWRTSTEQVLFGEKPMWADSCGQPCILLDQVY